MTEVLMQLASFGPGAVVFGGIAMLLWRELLKERRQSEARWVEHSARYQELLEDVVKAQATILERLDRRDH